MSVRCSCGSYAINHHMHGRDGSDPDLCDVCYWRKRSGNSPLKAGTQVKSTVVRAKIKHHVIRCANGNIWREISRCEEEDLREIARIDGGWAMREASFDGEPGGILL